MQITLADLYGDASSIWERVLYAAHSELFWIALIVAVVALTPNTAYVWIARQIKTHIVKPTPPHNPNTVTVVPGTVPEIKTAQDVSNLYHQFKAQRTAEIAELEALLAKKKQELIDLDKMISQVTPTPVIGVMTP